VATWVLRFDSKLLFIDFKYYGDQGPMTVDTVPSDILPIWFNAARELGYPIADPNGKQIES